MLRIVITSGPESGRSLDSGDLTEIEIGRQARHLRVTDGRVSRVHCCFEKNDAGEWYIADRHSKHGTKHNGRLVAGRARIEDGDRVNIGSTVIRCFISKPTIVVEDPAVPLPRIERPTQHKPPVDMPASNNAAETEFAGHTPKTEPVREVRKAKPAPKPAAPKPAPQPVVKKEPIEIPEVKPVSAASKNGEEAADCWMDAIMSEMVAFVEDDGEIVQE